MPFISLSDFKALQNQFSGEFYFDGSAQHQSQLIIYATDASVYQEQPIAVAIPKNEEDLKKLIVFAQQFGVTLIPRAAGTSLAGQVVGKGIVVDISKYFCNVIEINQEECWVRVQPGIIRDDLNAILKPYDLFFGPETSTSSRAMIGGMIGNNSCGLHSMVWGDTRSHLKEAKVLLSDGSDVVFKEISTAQLQEKKSLKTIEGGIYRGLDELLDNKENLENIKKNYPKRTLKRRNTGYALDILAEKKLQNENFDSGFNLCKLLAGSEGTLSFVTEAKLNLLPLPPKEIALVCIHCVSIQESLHANLLALKHNPMACELVDKYILDFTIGHPTYSENRFFIEGDPAAILMVEFMAEDDFELDKMAHALVEELKMAKLGYAFPILKGEKVKLAWEVRKAGLGLIRNLKGDVQAVNLIEDCAVAPEDLPNYIADVQALLARHSVNASYYAHAGAGELHVEPMLNLKTTEGKHLFKQILKETVVLVKKYNGSLSGEHGDGRLRGEFIEEVLGKEIFQLIKHVKLLFDPKSVFNANKIIDTPPMNEFLRFEIGENRAEVKTYFDFSDQEGILRMAEKCSGSGDCRKTELTGGTMCPSYMATKNEKDTTRARANILRNYLTNSQKTNPFDQQEIMEVMDLCVSCKGCKSECPSKVDVGKMKAEFLQHYYDQNGVPFKTWLIGNFTRSQKIASYLPSIYNYLTNKSFTSKFIKAILGFENKRSLPKIAPLTLQKWFKKQAKMKDYPNGRVYLFCDEFTNYNDVAIGQKAIKLLENLGYEVIIPIHLESGRTYLSKGLLIAAKKIAIKNIELLSQNLQPDIPIIGIEPSAILTLRDEYLDLVPNSLKDKASAIAKRSFLIDEFLANEIKAKKIKKEQFTDRSQMIKLHGHCHQKALSSLAATKIMLSLPKNYEVQLIPSGCCGMAGSFGYEKEHYEVSMKIGELVLFPAIRSLNEDVIIAANGTSCRHQIFDGTGAKSFHPVEILWEALNEKS